MLRELLTTTHETLPVASTPQEDPQQSLNPTSQHAATRTEWVEWLLDVVIRDCAVLRELLTGTHEILS